MSELKRFQFPEGFLWGAATASYQIEGATEADGRKPSIWDTFCAKQGTIKDASSGKDACRHYDKWEEDLDLLKWLGMGAYRFSIAWPRIVPEGWGAVNQKGLDWYERLVDGMLQRGIKPNATLYHWDLPQPLEDKGGWLNRDTAKAYAEYAHVVLKRLGNRLAMVATHNEPQVFVGCGYRDGVHAPGRKESEANLAQMIHNVLISHGLGIQAIRQHAPKAQAGIVLAPAPVWPNSDDPKDLAASELHWEDSNDWWVLPMMAGRYPEGSFMRRGAAVPTILPGDMELISQKMDFMGLNYYSPARTVHTDKAPFYAGVPHPKDAVLADMPGWEDFPAGIENELIQFSRRYPKIPIYITENGISVKSDSVGEDGKVHDPRRLAFLSGHLIHCLRAIEQGVDLRGYFVWSLMDNFEWGFGYTQRFGITHVDYSTFKRTPKESAHWYRETAKNNGFEAKDLPILPSAFLKAQAKV
jgi:beta-glucosidase